MLTRLDRHLSYAYSMLHAVNEFARPWTWRLGDRLSTSERYGNCLWSLESWVACRRFRRLSALSSILTSQVLLSVELFACVRHCLVSSHRCGADLVSPYCIRRWPRLFIFITLTEANAAGDGTDFHTQALPNAVAIPSALSLSLKQPWNLKPCTLSLPWPV